MSAPVTQFNPYARLLHWLMALMIIAMLFIGVGMVSTTTDLYARLVAIHKPLGVTILVLALLRLGVRLTHKPPPLPSDLPAWQRHAATLSHWLLYALMLLMPLVGWAMLSAGGYPVTLVDGLQLPPLAPLEPELFAFLRGAHHYLALLLFATFLLHLGAALFHALIRRDGVLSSMAPWRARRYQPGPNAVPPAENDSPADTASSPSNADI